MYNPGEYFSEGIAQEKDTDQATEWYRKALEAGYEPDEQEYWKTVLGDDDPQE